MIISKKLDIHSIIHFVGSYAIAMTLSVFGLPLWAVAIMAIMLGVSWEILDELNLIFNRNISWLDSRGGDLTDIGVDVLGVLLAAGIIYAI